MHVWDAILHYGNEEFSNTQPLNDVMNDVCMKTYACMLPRVICEECVGLCHIYYVGFIIMQPTGCGRGRQGRGQPPIRGQGRGRESPSS